MIGFALVKPASMALVIASSSTAFPRLDVHRVCHERSSAVRTGVDDRRCLDDERAAGRKMQRNWSRIPIEFKRICLYDKLPPSPSYMSLISCLRNNLLVTDYRHRKPGQTIVKTMLD